MYHLIWWKWRTKEFWQICRAVFRFLTFMILGVELNIGIPTPRETLEISKKQQTPYFHTSTTAREWRCENMGFVVVFFLKYKIGNNDFITILGSENLNSVMFTTNYCSNPTVNVPVGSITHLESPWTLNITPILSTVSRDLILGLKNQNYHNPDVFYSWIPPRSSSDKIRIHWIMIYMFEIHQFFDETYPSYVPFIPYYHTW